MWPPPPSSIRDCTWSGLRGSRTSKTAIVCVPAFETYSQRPSGETVDQQARKPPWIFTPRTNVSRPERSNSCTISKLSGGCAEYMMSCSGWNDRPSVPKGTGGSCFRDLVCTAE